MELQQKSPPSDEEMEATHIRMITGLLSEHGEKHMLRVLSKVLFQRASNMKPKEGDKTSQDAIGVIFEKSRLLLHCSERIEGKQRKR